jgi:hypothetical protein
MNTNELRDNLMQMKGAVICTVNAETTPKMRKTDNPYVDVVKVSSVNGIINWIYEDAVNKQRSREELEPNFTAFPRKWGNRIKGSPLVEHNGNYYLEMKVQSAQAQYILGNEEIAVSELIPYFYDRSKSRQGVEKEVVLRDYALENIKSIKYAGQLIEIS